MKSQKNSQPISAYSKSVVKAFSTAIDKMLHEKAKKNEKIAISENGKVKVIAAKQVLRERDIRIS